MKFFLYGASVDFQNLNLCLHSGIEYGLHPFRHYKVLYILPKFDASVYPSGEQLFHTFKLL